MICQNLKLKLKRFLSIDKTNLWANVFLLSIAEKIEDWDYAEKKAKDLKKD